MKKLVEIIPTLEVGGAEKLVVSLISFYDYDIVDLYLIVLFDKDKNMYKNEIDHLPIKVFYMNKNDGLDLHLFTTLAKTLSSINPDSIHTHLYASSYVLPWMFFHRGVIWGHTVHSIASKELYSFHIPLMWVAYKLKLANPIAISQEVKQTVIDFYSLSKKNVKVITNGIDLSKFKSKIKNNSKKFEIINVGHLNDNKNQIFLLYVMREFKRNEKKYYHLTILGDGPNRKLLESFVKNNELEDYVKFEGLVYNVNEYLSKGDILILPSKYEGIPLSIIEAMASGLPVIATDVGGISEMINNGENGFLIQLENIDETIAIIEKLNYNRDLYYKISQKVIIDSRKYNIKNITRKYEEFLVNVKV